MNGFPLSAEQVVRLVAAVVAEVTLSADVHLDERPDAILLRLADAVGVPLDTYPHPLGRSCASDQPRPRDTRGLGVMPYKGELDFAPIDYAEMVSELRARLDSILLLARGGIVER
jgi:hypothetical protein